VRPHESEILDIFLHGSEATRRRSFFDLKEVSDYDLRPGGGVLPNGSEMVQCRVDDGARFFRSRSSINSI
jgi:hypothetical protein